MNCVNQPTKLNPDELFQLRVKTFDRLGEVLTNPELTNLEIGPDNFPVDICYDCHGGIILRVQPSDPDAVLKDIREACPEAMKTAEAESREGNHQYPNVAFAGVKFVVFNKEDVDAICNGIDLLCGRAYGGNAGIEALEDDVDPRIRAMGIAFARLFDRQGGLIYNDNHAPIRMYNNETVQTIKDAEEGKNLSGPYNSVSELMADLDSDDDSNENAPE